MAPANWWVTRSWTFPGADATCTATCVFWRKCSSQPSQSITSPAPAAIETARLATAGIEADPLREALVRLGSRVLDPGR